MHWQLEDKPEQVKGSSTGLAATAAPSSERNYDEFGTTSSASAMLKAHGFKPGGGVQRKQDKLIGSIAAITSEHLVLVLDSGKQVKASVAAFLEGKWVPYECLEEIVPGWQSLSPSKCEEMLLQKAGANLMLEIIATTQKHSDADFGLDVYSKPKMVKASKAFAVGKCVLVASAPTLQKKILRNNESLSSGTPVGSPVMLGEGRKAQFYLTSCFTYQGKGPFFVNPYWLVKGVDKKEDAVMEHVAGKVPIMRNIRALQPGDVLTVFEPKKLVLPEERPEVSPDKAEPAGKPKAKADAKKRMQHESGSGQKKRRSS